MGEQGNEKGRNEEEWKGMRKVRRRKRGKKKRGTAKVKKVNSKENVTCSYQQQELCLPPPDEPRSTGPHRYC